MTPASSTICRAPGKPLLVRYDLDAVRGAADSRGRWPARPAGMWKWRELLPLPEGAEPVSLGEPETPLIPLDRIGARHGARALLVKDEGRLPTGSFKARGLAMAVSMAKAFRGEAHRHADQRQCRRGARRLWRARRGSRRWSSARPKRPRSTSARPRPMAPRSIVADGQIDECGAHRRRGRGGGPLVRLLDAEGALPARGQEGDGAGAGRAVRLGAARRDLLPDRRRHRPDRHVEGLRRAGGGSG